MCFHADRVPAASQSLLSLAKREGIGAGLRCPLWVEGTLPEGRYIRRSLKLSNWKRAHELVHGWEAGEPEDAAKPVDLESAITAFESDAKARGLRESTLLKYKVLFQQLRAFAALKGYRFLKEFTVEIVREFRASWPDQPISALKKLERMRAFLRFCADRIC